MTGLMLPTCEARRRLSAKRALKKKLSLWLSVIKKGKCIFISAELFRGASFLRASTQVEKTTSSGNSSSKAAPQGWVMAKGRDTQCDRDTDTLRASPSFVRR